jgi:hypothetical protein
VNQENRKAGKEELLVFSCVAARQKISHNGRQGTQRVAKLNERTFVFLCARNSLSSIPAFLIRLFVFFPLAELSRSFPLVQPSSAKPGDHHHDREANIPNRVHRRSL